MLQNFGLKWLTLDVRLPRSIFSNPTANTQSLPDSTNCFAIIKALDPVEQLLFTLKIGMPVIPTSYIAL